MRAKFLDLLRDPYTNEKFNIRVFEKKKTRIIEGELYNSTSKYPIRGGIPRFTQKTNNYTDSFGFQWKKWSKIQFDSENIGKPMEFHTSGMWGRIVGDKRIKNKIIGDFGCGSGRFIEVCRNKGAIVVGVDMSDAVDAAYSIFQKDDNVFIVQADILNLPFKRGIFDGGYSIGVLQHTKNYKKAFSSISGTINKGGWFAVSSYGEEGYYTAPLVEFYRSLFKKLWSIFGPYPALFYTYVIVSFRFILKSIPLISKIRYLMDGFFPSVELPSYNWSILDTFDSVTPSYQKGISYHQMYKLFEKNGFTSIFPSSWYGTSINAYKK